MAKAGVENGLRWGVFLLCAGVVAYGIFRATPPPQLFHQSDKVGHVLAFLGLSLTAWWAFRRVPWFFFGRCYSVWRP